MTDIELRTARNQIAAREYEDVTSVSDALTDRQKMAAAVEVAKKAGVQAREWLWNARESERTLGRMILAAREAGDLADRGQDPSNVGRHDISTLADLGVGRDLAAYSVQLAEVPDEVWDNWHAQAAEVEPTRVSVGKTVAAWRAAQTAAEEDVKRAARERKAAEAEIDRLRQRLSDVAERAAAARARTGIVPPLTDHETSVNGVDVAMMSVLPEQPKPEAQQASQASARAWDALASQIEDLIGALEKNPPPLPGDRFLDLTVLSARELAQRVTTAVALWLRKINSEYDERLSDGTR